MARMTSNQRTKILQAIIPIYLVLCVMFGGASAAGALANAFLQLFAIPILWAAAVTRADRPLTPALRQLILFAALVVLVFAIQLTPLPPAIWTRLPGRAIIADGYRLLGLPLPYLSVSLMPYRTLAALLGLLPVAAVLFGMVRLGAFHPRLIAWYLGAIACLSVLLGAVQLAGGPYSPPYVYERSSFGVAAGFFANANHFGTLMLMTIPLLAAALGGALDRRGDRKRTSAIVVSACAMIVLLLVGTVITRSLAAIGLLLPVAAGSFCIVRWRHGHTPRWIMPVMAVLVAGVLVTVAVEPFDNDLTTTTARTTQLSRYTKYVNTLKAIPDYLPIGAGIGTMPFVYHLYENPAEVTRTYPSHTHSDPLEIMLDAGIPGMVLIVLFVVGWGWRTVAIWRAQEPDGFARAATIASGAAMAHSFVDYPLRTTADAAVFVAMIALMAGAQAGTIASQRKPENAARHMTA